MSSSTELAPLGGVLDDVLSRLAAMEKFADSSAPPSTSTAPPNAATSNNNTDDAALIQSLQSELTDLRKQLEASEKQRQSLESQLASAGGWFCCN
mmetsp:Transcript_23206/g.50242  ORF Transcript_23206/g.50242 Transcript_23206/m.50242 type:complete len:95 (-) Transcript_23206:1009-1293(-)|eukprot:CAMPEP_0172305932 /NCGR_PEP_ID=MMETSP1058-20130122/7127_1 /TAXON_ID=83371 /ORGANISM="Detonula confervacea, Strain CCMP 353" /LENGTH=94 /DNA_ID=CAMNT_0013017681 /DNA_START=65 /DNA_END=349 /DNA_ORIENTATION=+